MNYLITGGNGLIGLNLANRLQNNGHNVILIDNKNTRTKKFKFLKIDITKEKKKINNCIKKFKIETIIHLAAFLGVKSTEQNPEKVINVNYNGTKNILSLCKKTNVKSFIFSSSSEVYGDQKKILSENLNLMPKSFYGFSKLQSEIAVKNFCYKEGLDFQIVRFFNIYGKKQKKQFVIPKFVSLAKKNKTLKVYGNGNQIRCFCYVNDAVEALLKIINLKKKNNIFNIGNDMEPISIINLAKKIIKITKSKSKIKKINFEKSDREKEREIYNRIPDLKKIKKFLNYKPKVSLDLGINLIK